MTAPRGMKIALALAAFLLLGADGAAATEVAAEAAKADPPWLVLAGIAVVGTLGVGVLGVLWARLLERAAPATIRSSSSR